jgi:hypothetical protein
VTKESTCVCATRIIITYKRNYFPPTFTVSFVCTHGRSNHSCDFEFGKISCDSCPSACCLWFRDLRAPTRALPSASSSRSRKFILHDGAGKFSETVLQACNACHKIKDKVKDEYCSSHLCGRNIPRCPSARTAVLPSLMTILMQAHVCRRIPVAVTAMSSIWSSFSQCSNTSPVSANHDHDWSERVNGGEDRRYHHNLGVS